jgi:hypothetical protein
MFSSLPKMADKNFVLGFLLPSLLGTLAMLYLLSDFEPFKSAYHAALAEKKFGSLAVWVEAALLVLGNELLYRCVEGYIGPFNRPKWRAKEQDKFSDERARLAHDRPTDNATITHEARAYYKRLGDLLERFPYPADLVLPTRLGNVMRAFETYPLNVYGVDSIPAWLRLQAVIPKEFQAVINDGRAKVDFCLNIWLFAIAITILAVALCALNAVELAKNRITQFEWIYLVALAIAVLTIWFAYEGAVAMARAWGGAVKSAFDLYLPELAKQLGHSLPETQDPNSFLGCGK